MKDPLFKRIRQHAQTRLTFPKGASPSDRMLALKDFMRLESQMLLRYHRKGDSGCRVARARAILTDVLIERLFTDALNRYSEENPQAPIPPVSLIALGGYGRAELNPASDIDLMFLYPDDCENLESLQKFFTEATLYPLWDLKLRLGHSSRTLSQALELSREDPRTLNALFDARLIVGDPEPCKNLYENLRDSVQKEPLTFLERITQTREHDYENFSHTIYLQEPNVKRGPGGLRDYHLLLWVGKGILGLDSVYGLLEKGYLTREQWRRSSKAFDFLMRVRNELHFHTRNPSDVLNLEDQPHIAYRLGYRHANLFERVESFMKDYYHHTYHLHQISVNFQKRLLSQYQPQEAKPKLPTQSFDGFILKDGELFAETNRTFNKDPARLLRVFRHAQQHRAEISHDLRHTIHKSLPLLTPRITRAPEAAETFLSIIHDLGYVAPALLKMHECGVLSRFIPDFKGLTCLVQHEFYHRYTADIHTLNTIKELDRLFHDTTSETAPYRQALEELSHPYLLYLILLLHDIGKAQGIKNHAARGMRIAGPILAHFDIPQPLRNQALLIIEFHLEMSHFWRHYDIDDPITGHALSALLESDPENLRLLYLHTYCDSRGTNPSLWNKHKEALHRRLYEITLTQIDRDQPYGLEKRYETLSEYLKKQPKLDSSRNEIDTHLSQMPDRYLMGQRKETIAKHLELVHTFMGTQSQTDQSAVLISWGEDHNQPGIPVHLICHDRSGLFYRLAGAFTLCGFNILSTHAFTRKDGIAVDTFYVLDETGREIPPSSQTKKHFSDTLRYCLTHKEDLVDRIAAASKGNTPSTFLKRNPADTLPYPSTLRLYYERNLAQNVLTLETTDHPGLLYKVARTISENHFAIVFARIHTEKSVAQDSFYLSYFGEDEAEDLRKLYKGLSQFLQVSPTRTNKTVKQPNPTPL